MDKIPMPTKEVIREWLKEEVKRHRPPPDPVQIRRELERMELERKGK